MIVIKENTVLLAHLESGQMYNMIVLWIFVVVVA